MSMTPSSTPKLTLKEALSYLPKGYKLPVNLYIVLAIRGYYKNTMGKPGINDRGIYDDAIVIIGPETFVAFNGNTDPSIYRNKVAVLKPGVWKYKPGQHGITFNRPGYPYPAFVQAAPVIVARDNSGDDTGYFGINIHKGSTTTTSSLGCQTIPPKQWETFKTLLYSRLKENRQKTFDYVLVEA